MRSCCVIGTLRHLHGLNIANNPLQYPPVHIIQQGTKVGQLIPFATNSDVDVSWPQAVLRYLAESLDDRVNVEGMYMRIMA